MGMDIYMEERLGKNEYEEVCYWRRHAYLIDHVERAVGFRPENGEYEPLNLKQMLLVQEYVLEACGERDDDDELGEFVYSLGQISKALIFLQKNEYIWFMASW